MAISEFEIKRVESIISKFVESRRPPAHVRDQVDLDFRISDQSVEIFEIGPLWNDPSVKSESPIAKATYVKSRKVWNIYWMMSDLKWHKYSPNPDVKLLEDFVKTVNEDKNACFWG
ncbi:hypothetical protein MNBD_GAMMA04-1610 [hydrothermal vent metagenome]|uniref:DUF3024 domain-containing protein n=1 Tax=hydrothermal vent metagenome TaxID=652676 RepID=A0A3B0VUN4_9ZZZZ